MQNLNIILAPAVLILGIACVAVSLWIMIAGLKHKFVVARSLDMALLLVLAPSKTSDQNANTLEKLREEIAVMEQFLAGLVTLKEKSRWKRMMIGNPHIALEVAMIDERVNFMLGVPRKYKNFLEKQLLGVIPDAKIEELPNDYSIFRENSAVGVSVGTLAKNSMFPIKTYRELESDSLREIANGFSKIEQGEGAAIQILIKPAQKGWEKAGSEAAKKIQEGKKLEGAGVAGQIGAGIVKELGDVIMPGTKTDEVKKNDQEKQERKDEKLTPAQQKLMETLEKKSSQQGFSVNMRVISCADTKEKTESMLDSLEGAFAQFHSSQTNSFKFIRRFLPKNKKLIWQYIFRSFDPKKSFILGSEELASIFHFPTIQKVQGVKELDSREAGAPANLPKDGITIGENNYRGVKTQIRISKEDRRRHMYGIGQTGTGKSVLLTNLILQDIKNGEGVCVIDPHSELIESILERIPKERAEDVIIFDPVDTERPLGFNLLESKNEGQKDLLANEAMSIFIKLFGGEIFGPRIQDYFRNGALTLMSDNENPGTLIDIVRLFTDDDFQKKWVEKVSNPVVKSFWENQMAKTGAREKQEMIPFFASKFGAFITNSTMRNIIGQVHSAFNFREIMDNQKILLVSLSKGSIGEINMSLLGMIIVAKLQMAAMSRSNIPEKERKDFYLYVDEFQNFASSSFASILSEARKYRLNLMVAHQYLSQIENTGSKEDSTNLRKAIFGNIGNIVTLRTGMEDAEILEKEFAPIFDKNDLANVSNLNGFARILVNGILSKPFSLHIPFPEDGDDPGSAKMLRELSSLRFGRARDDVESEIFERLGNIQKEINKEL